MEKQRNFSRQLVVLLTIVIVFFGLRLITDGQNKSLEVEPVGFRVLEVDSYYSEAYSLAFKWESDAFLTYVSPTFTLPSNDAVLLITYGFRSHSKPEKWLNIFFADTIPVQIQISEGQFAEGDRRPLPKEIDFNKLMFDSLDAINLAYEHGGDDFIKNNLGVTSDSFVGLHQENQAMGKGDLVWIVTFASDRTLVMYVTIDPFSGEVINVWRNDE